MATNLAKKISDFPKLSTPNSNTTFVVDHTANSGIANTYSLPLNTLSRNIFSTKSSPTTSNGAIGDVAGDIVISNTGIYFCYQTYTDGSTTIWKQLTWSNTTW